MGVFWQARSHRSASCDIGTNSHWRSQGLLPGLDQDARLSDTWGSLNSQSLTVALPATLHSNPHPGRATNDSFALFKNFLFILKIVWTWVFCLHICVSLQGSEEKVRSGTGVMEGYEPPCWCWGMEHSLVPEQVLLSPWAISSAPGFLFFISEGVGLRWHKMQFCVIDDVIPRWFPIRIVWDYGNVGYWLAYIT